MTQADDQLGIVWPHQAVPGSLAIVSTKLHVARLQELQAAQGGTLYQVHAVVGDHIPLVGGLGDIINYRPANGLTVNEPPLTIYLHHGGRDAVFLDLNAFDDGALSEISVEVEAGSPPEAFAAARSAVNELLDVLMRRLWLPLVLTRLDLHVGDEANPIAHQVHVPFAGGLSVGPLAGIHQYPLFSELESLAREAICTTSPYYRLLCAYRLYEGIGALRGRIRQILTDLSPDIQMPKDLKVDSETLAAMGLGALSDSGVRTVGDLHGKMTDLRNQVAHFLLTKGEPAPPLHTSNGYSYQVFSMAGAALLHYGFLALQELASFFRQNLEGRLLVGSVLPVKEQRSRYRVVARPPER